MEKRSMKRKNLKKRKLKIFLCIAIPIVLFIGGLLGTSCYHLNRIKRNNLPNSSNELGINEDKVKEIKNRYNNGSVTNILILGVDKEEEASDVIMVLSLDKYNKQIKLTSILRDTYIQLGENKINKINYAYHYGGPTLSVKTINETFDLDIKDYVLLNFDAVEKIVDELGGVDITIKDYEVGALSPDGIVKAGKQHLDGKKALAYARMRKSGDGDPERTDRQRRVIEALFTKLNSNGKLGYANIVMKLIPYVETSMTNGEIISTGSSVISWGGPIKQLRLPADEDKNNTLIKSIFYWQWDKDKTVKKLQDFIYGNN